jgi:hypothetical protein
MTKKRSHERDEKKNTDKNERTTEQNITHTAREENETQTTTPTPTTTTKQQRTRARPFRMVST